MTTTRTDDKLSIPQAEQAAHAEQALRGMVSANQARSEINYLINQHVCTESCTAELGYGTCF